MKIILPMIIAIIFSWISGYYFYAASIRDDIETYGCELVVEGKGWEFKE